MSRNCWCTIQNSNDAFSMLNGKRERHVCENPFNFQWFRISSHANKYQIFKTCRIDRKNGTNQPTWILYVDYFDNSDDSKKKTRCDTFFFLENDSAKGEQIYKWKTYPSLSSSLSKIKGNIQDGPSSITYTRTSELLKTMGTYVLQMTALQERLNASFLFQSQFHTRSEWNWLEIRIKAPHSGIES